MSALLGSLLRVWFLLIVLTLISLLVAEELDWRTVSITGIFAIAAIKAELIIDHFMEARLADRHWLIMYLIWVLAVTALLTVGHLST
jgi:heme/copper-type cytochrome/quinol oxidase subunit 4